VAAFASQLDSLVSKYEQESRDSTEPVPQWVLPPLSCRLLEDIAKLLPPDSHAFEFGSGRSTHALRRGFSAVYSVEHSADWLQTTETASAPKPGPDKLDGVKPSSLTTEVVGKRSTDETFVVPLRRCWNRLRPIESFDLANRAEILAGLRRSRLILVDSPPNPAKREHALFLALRHAPVGGVIVLDDLAVRATARFALRLAKQNARTLRFWPLNIDHHLGVFLKLRDRSVRSRPTLREFVGTWLRA